MIRAGARDLWRRDRGALVAVAAGSLLATIGWRATSRPMADTVSYRFVAEGLASGWDTIADRTPGYPLLLLATGSSDRSTTLLFLVQLSLHVAATLLVIDLARRAGVGRHGRTAVALLLQAPVVLIRVVSEGTEALTAFGVTLAAWLVLVPPPTEHRVRRAVALGVTCGLTGLVRPNFALLFVPATVAAWSWRRTDATPGPRFVPIAAAVALPAVAIVGGYVAANAVRFDQATLTPLTPYHLSSRTSAYVEELPARYEPARTVLIEARDEALLRGEQFAPANFIWEARDELAEATGKDGAELDRYVLEMDLWLIVHNPFGYLDAVEAAGLNITSMDSQPAVAGLGTAATWVQQAAHELLLWGFVAAMVLLPGLGLAGRIRHRAVTTLVVTALIASTSLLVAIATETGTARLRAPVEPLLALLLVTAISVARPSLLTGARQLRHPEGNS